MNTAKLESVGEGKVVVSGILDATTVTALLKRSDALFAGPALQVDLAGVTESDSAGLALMLEWLRLARKKNQQISFVNMPQQIAALARISEVEDLFHPNGTASEPQFVAAAV